MHHWLHKGHCQFNLRINGLAQVIIGTMVSIDDKGYTIVDETTGLEHGYGSAQVEHICLAP